MKHPSPKKASSLMALFLVLANLCYAAKIHPRLFYTDEKISELKAQIKQDTAVNHAWLFVLAKADKALTQANLAGATDDLGLAYRMTGDPKYAAKIKELLLAACKKTTWESPEMLNRDPAWRSGLNSADQSYKVAVGFDCIYDQLLAEERKSIAGALVKLGIEPALGDWVLGNRRIHTLNSMGHNWWSAAVFMAGVSALAIRDEVPEAKGWVRAIEHASVQWFNFAGDQLNNKPATFDREGGFYESVGYAAFASKEYLLYRLAYRNSLGVNAVDVPLLNTLGDFFTNASYPSGATSMMLNFGDSHVDNRDWYPLLLLMANGYQSGRYLTALNNLQKGLATNVRYYYSAFGLVYNQQKNKPAELVSGLPDSKLYPDMGWAMLRSSWKNDADMLAVKSGTTWNHAHADANSFILFHDGENLLTDGGTVIYNNPQYSDYFFQSGAHNVVLFNGEGQSKDDEYFGVKTPGKLYNLMDAGDFKYIYGDATGPTSKNFERNYRHFLWIGNVLLIIDDLKAREAGKMEWLLHYGDARAKQEGLDIRITKNKAHVLVRPLFPETLPNGGFSHDFPEKLILTEKEGIHDHTTNIKENYYAIAAPEKMRQTKWITAVILADEQDSNLPVIEKIEGRDMIGVKLTQNGMVTKVYLNLQADGKMMGRNSNNSFDGWETDAYLTAVSYPVNGQNNIAGVNRYFIANGSYLRKDGAAVLNSIAKVFMVADVKPGKLDVQLQGQPIMEAELYAPGKPKQVSLNGRLYSPAYTDKDPTATVIVADPEHQLQAKQLLGDR
jgi:hypothetical protein